ncbi:hypothetical protein DH2020_022360 [Rehmannia glutinosa]|uniref:Pollen Ole e 1 allergen and extensin family protein n=1 Tax=Rehmannia glutinosa TaxID=99300 RepID=A0ABR0WHC6_REHGL
MAMHPITAHAAPPKPVEKPVDVVVEGVVYCPSCKTYGSWSLTEPTPLKPPPSASSAKTTETEVQNEPLFLDHPLHACKVKMVSSPLESCNVLTNVNYGLNGAPLRYEDKRLVGSNYEAVIYSAGPLAFRPAHCAPKAEP